MLLIASLLALAGRCFHLQYLKSTEYLDACLRQQRSYVDQPRRGEILDCCGRVLAASNRIRIIFAEPRRISDKQEVSNKLAPIVGMEPNEICRLINESGNPGYVEIKLDADINQCSDALKIPGIGVQTGWRRHYPMGSLVANIIGFTGRENTGLEGLELKYDKAMRGTPAQNVFFADVHRRPIRIKQQEGVLNDGYGIILTIDATIQQFVRDELAKQCEAYEAESAVAIVAEPKTGAILAMVSLPDFDPANIGTTDPNNFRSRVVTDWYEPGSIIKPLVLAIALDAGVVNKQERIFCEYGNYHGKGFGRIGEYRRGFGDLTIREIIVNSSNIGMAKIGQRIGAEKLYDGLTFFGFGKKTGIELPGEVEGLLRPTRDWTGYSVTRIPFGQEICVTAMQLVRAYCILINNGRLVRPFLVRAVVDAKGEVTEIKRPLPSVGYIIQPETAEWIVTEAMTGVVNDSTGTGNRAKLDKWKVFGKTGTANIANSDSRGYSESEYVASFIAGAPVDDPAIIVLVSIRKPNRKLGKGYTGGTVAAPVAKVIIEKTLNYLGVD